MKPKNLPPLTPDADNQNPDMETYLKTLQTPEYTNSFNQTASWVRQQHLKRNAPQTWLENLRIVMFGSAFRMAYTIMILVFLVGACIYPIEVNEPVATVLRWDVNAQNEPAVAAINQLPWLQEQQLLVKEINNNGQTTLEYTYTLPAVNKDVLQTYRKKLEQIAGVRNLAILPVTHKTSQPLYEAALENMLKIEMDVTDISDADLKKSVETKLEQQGLPGVDINIIKTATGQRMIVTKLPEMPTKDYGFDLTLKDGKRHTRIKEQVKLKAGKELPDFKNLTDAEIKAFIIKDHPHTPLKPEDIMITRQGSDILISVDDKSGNQLKLRVK